MSVIVACKYKDGVIVAADKRVSTGCRLHEDFTTKISTAKYSHHVKGAVGSLRYGNLINVKDELMNYEDILEQKDVDLEYVISVIVPNLINYLTEQHALDTKEDVAYMNSEMIYVTGKRIFSIWSDFSVVEYPTWCALGCGDEMVDGFLSNFSNEYLSNLSEDDAVDLMGSCIINACSKDSAVSEEFEYTVVKNPDKLEENKENAGETEKITNEKTENASD